MSPLKRMRWRGREVHTLAGAYVMDAVCAADRARFERHLAGCRECAQEIEGLRETTARLATAAAAAPPPGLKERVMAAAVGSRQHPPDDVVATAATARGLTGLRARTRTAWPGRLALTAGAVAAAAVLAVAVVFGLANGSMREQLSQDRASSQQIAAVLTARDARMQTQPVRGGGTATIVMSHAMGELVFTAAGLRTLPSSRGYELWLVGPAGTRAVGMLPRGSHDMAGPVVAAGLRPGDHLVLTAEPDGGTSRPTTPMMLNVVLLAWLTVTYLLGLDLGTRA
jgi:anti-sigma-K factor RskA